VFGFGNPGKEYEKTRHNVGFLVIDALAKKYKKKVNQYSFQSLSGKVKIGKEEVLLVKPLTYMNLAGIAVRDVLQSFKLQPKDILVVNDDADLELGRIKISRGGGDAGHLGIRSAIEKLGSKEFPRLRVGIGRPPEGMHLRDYVLEEFTPEEWKVIQKVLSECVLAVETIVLEGIEKAMARFNQTIKNKKRNVKCLENQQ